MIKERWLRVKGRNYGQDFEAYTSKSNPHLPKRIGSDKHLYRDANS